MSKKRYLSGASALALGALALAGCGGGGQNAPTPAPLDGGQGAVPAASVKAPAGDKAPAKPATRARSTHAKAAARGQATAHAKAHANHAKAAPKSSTRHATHRATPQRNTSAHSPSPRQQIRRLSAARREALARHAAKAALAIYGIKNGQIGVGSGARSVTVGVPASKVCTLPPDATTRIVGSIKKSAPWVRQVHVTIAGSSQSLASYRSAHCRTTAPPKGSGKKVFEELATGNRSATVKITGKRWTVSWANFGAFFSVNVEQNGKPAPDYLYSTEPGTGKKTFTDGPGEFTLLMSGPSWKVEVYDG